MASGTTNQPTRRPGAAVFEREAILVYPAQSRRDIGDDLLPADDENHVAGAGDQRTELAAARRRDQHGPFRGDRVNAPDDEIRRGGELPHLAPLHLAVHLVQTRAKGLVQA